MYVREHGRACGPMPMRRSGDDAQGSVLEAESLLLFLLINSLFQVRDPESYRLIFLSPSSVSEEECWDHSACHSIQPFM